MNVHCIHMHVSLLDVTVLISLVFCHFIPPILTIEMIIQSTDTKKAKLQTNPNTLSWHHHFKQSSFICRYITMEIVEGLTKIIR